jgi:predicted nucleotidyltransferase
MSSVDPAALQEAVIALRQALSKRLIAVVLFGSRARGEAHETSDWDLLVIARDLPAKTLARHLLLKNALPAHWRAKVAILGKTPEEFEAALPSLYLDIALDGIALYDPEDYATVRLARLRRLIEIRGLRREADRRDLAWHWQQFPGFNWSLEWEGA